MANPSSGNLCAIFDRYLTEIWGVHQMLVCLGTQDDIGALELDQFFKDESGFGSTGKHVDIAMHVFNSFFGTNACWKQEG